MISRSFAACAALAAATMMPSALAAGEESGNGTNNTIDKLMMFSVAVSNMPAARAFYVDKLGMKVASDNRRTDDHWWVSLTPPEGGPSIVLTTYHENMKPGTMKLYFATSDVAAAHERLGAKGVKVDEVKDDLFGPGSGVRWFSLEDPDGNQVLLVQATR
jgi:catechol 2,3-dioxygenase-like lactoylglutathione lyase family enzyme